jgi:EAL and modified HD-GYP domain-containing signal transduction protein
MADDEPTRSPEDTDPQQPRIDMLALVARQGIYDRALTVVAYELLYRRSAEAMNAEVLDGRRATLDVITNAVLEIGLDRLAGNMPVHINYPQELLATCPPLPAAANRVIIEVLEHTRAEPAVVAGIQALRARGHRIALDDYSPRISDSALLDLADIVKIDVSQHTPQELIELTQALRPRGLTLTAEHVETAEDLERSMALGFDAFQGYFLHHPQMFAARRIPQHRIGILRLVALLQNEMARIDEIERLISQDIALSYRVLRCLNSSYYGLPKRVDSIGQAIVILGFDRLRELCALAALLEFGDRPSSLVLDAMTRARMCEHLGRLRGLANTAPFFTTGLFSLLDALTGIPMAELVHELPLAPGVVKALLTGEGDAGQALHAARAYEHGALDLDGYGGWTCEQIQLAYVEAVSWAEAARQLISA